MLKKQLTLLLVLLVSMAALSQTKEQAKILFKKGEYAKAKPAFQKYLRNNKNDGSLNYWYGVCCYETGEQKKAIPYLQVAAGKKVQNAFRYLGDYYMLNGQYEEAITQYESFLEMVEPSDTLFQIYSKKLKTTKAEQKLMRRVEKICIVDSTVVSKTQFLSAYNLGEESGLLETFSHYFNADPSAEGTVFQTEMGNVVYYSQVTEGGYMQLYTRYKMLDEWSRPTPLEGFNENSNNHYPFLLSDGVTLYFANDGEESLGGYDIFVTRYNSDTGRYLAAENVGMPFNSKANDYMLAIDEVNNLGWFATDRNQPEGKVCIYTFVPNKEKVTFDYDTDNRLLIKRAAEIVSIKETQTDPEAMKAAQQSLLLLSIQQTEMEGRKRDFVFVIDDFTDYSKLSDFKSSTAKELFQTWQKQQKAFNQLEQTLDGKRDEYAKGNAAAKARMKEELLKLEAQYEKLETEIGLLELQTRNEEKKYLSNKH